VSDPGLVEKLLDGAEVERRPLEEIIVSLKTGLNPRENFRLNTSDAEGYYVTVREIQGGKISFLGQTDRVNQEALKQINNRSNLEAGDILFSGVGTVGRVVLIKASPENWNIKEGVYAIKPNKEKVRPAYLAYLLSSRGIVAEYQKKVVGSPVVSLPMKELRKLLFPIPCPDDPEKSLAIQGEIVRILESFTELTAELTAELAARKKQYNHYRDQLLTFQDGEVDWKALGDVVSTVKTGKLNANAMVSDGQYPFFTCDAKPYRIDTYAFDTEAIIVSGNGSQVGHINYYNGKFNAYQRTYILADCSEEMTIKFLLAYLRAYLRPYIIQHSKKGSVPYITKPMLEGFKVPVPSQSRQFEITEMLDKFDTLTTSLSEGLPREIALRQQQYEYYRDLLLSFPKPAEAVEA
jgi:type I restriction enzyme S subunit